MPAGTFLAAKVNLRVAIRGTLDVLFNGETRHIRFSAVQTQTFWQVPDVGIVKASSVITVSARLPILGAQTATLHLNQELESFSN